MKTDFDILSKLVKRKKPEVPEGFFTAFGSAIDQVISPGRNDDAADFGKRQKPEVPADFFAGFHANLKTAIETEDIFENLKLKKSPKPELPGNFERDFFGNLMQQINRKKSTGRILKITFWSTASAVAAGLTLLFTLNTGQTNTETPITNSETTAQDEETVDAYMAYLDEEELVDYILENEIEIEETETEEAVYDCVDQDLEEIYMEDIYGDL